MHALILLRFFSRDTIGVAHFLPGSSRTFLPDENTRIDAVLGAPLVFVGLAVSKKIELAGVFANRLPDREADQEVSRAERREFLIETH